jgi:DNA-binding SARP family transcriptional activator
VPPAGPSLQVFGLGALRIFRDGVEIEQSIWARQKARTLYACLLCARPQRLHKEELIELLWPSVDPGRGDRLLQVTLSDLRAALGGGSREAGRRFVSRVGQHYGLEIGPAGWIDVEAFDAEYEAGVRADQAGDPPRAARHLEAAESLYGGDFLVEERFAAWAGARRERLRDRCIDALRRLARLHETAGEIREAAAYTKKLVFIDPYLEPCYRDLMRYLHLLGDHGGVVQTYLRCRDAMREGLDSDVAPETRRLAERLLGASVDAVVERHAGARRRASHASGTLPPRWTSGAPGVR